MLLAEEEYKAMKKQEMKEDVMKSLEYRTYDSKREMDILDAMDQVKTLNRRENNVNYDELIRKVVKEEDKVKEEKEKEKEKIKKIFEEKKNKIEEEKKEEKVHCRLRVMANICEKMCKFVGRKPCECMRGNIFKKHINVKFL